jgi:hypothetical protein
MFPLREEQPSRRWQRAVLAVADLLVSDGERWRWCEWQSAATAQAGADSSARQSADSAVPDAPRRAEATAASVSRTRAGRESSRRSATWVLGQVLGAGCPF